jgi:four helix bundle protein
MAIGHHGVHVKDFRELKVWEKAHEMALRSYRPTEAFPKHELFGMASQIRRCSASIPANIAEGCGAPGQQRVASVSANRLWFSQRTRILLLARDLGYLPSAEHLSAQKQLLAICQLLELKC